MAVYITLAVLTLLHCAAVSQGEPLFRLPPRFRGLPVLDNTLRKEPPEVITQTNAEDNLADIGGNEPSLVSDAEALLHFKNSIVQDPYGYLDSWHEVAGVCEWRGVTCTDKRVTSLVILDSGFRGRLSEALGSLTLLKGLVISNGFLTGSIPQSLQYLHHLQVLDLSSNRLTGGIPESVCGLPDLSFLHLSDNQLRGRIPSQCSTLSPTAYFNVSHNHLEGPIPEGQLTKLTRQSFVANSGLCGLPLVPCTSEQLRAKVGTTLDDWTSARPLHLPPVPQLRGHLAVAGGILAVAAVLAGIFVSVRLVGCHSRDSPLTRASPRRGLRNLAAITETNPFDGSITGPLLSPLQGP